MSSQLHRHFTDFKLFLPAVTPPCSYQEGGRGNKIIAIFHLPILFDCDAFEQQSYHLSNCNKIHCCWGCWAYDCNYEFSNCFSPTIEVNFTRADIKLGLLQGVRFIRVEEF
ncbi:hypothetical protein CEXT_584481 [Caerostris extrusa]|uniref:Uncharacterized protein n=1 Tax=Caerostris extrusa TaxID=172846 RepID=A0AAV4U713_CAEEX|nr:hypothetical protein CEXT_584481 [Caerostris extrusa]